MVKECNTFCFLPFLSISNEIVFGRISFWPFQEGIERGALPQDHRLLIEKIANSWQTRPPNSRPLNITLVEVEGKISFDSDEGPNGDAVRSAVLALFLSTVIRNNQAYARTSNDFKTIYQNFQVGRNSIAFTSGSIVQVTDGGYKIGEIISYKPVNVATGRPFAYEGNLVESLGKLYYSKKHRMFSRRIFKSLEWLFTAYSNDDDYTYDSRIVAISTAFEFLFNGFNGKWDFAKKIDQYVGVGVQEPKFFVSSRSVFRKGGIKNREKHSLKEWWACEFYELRNKIVHGVRVESGAFLNRKDQSYFLLAVKMFEQALKFMLEEKQFYDRNYSDTYKCKELFSNL